MPGKSFEQVYCCTFVSKVCEERSASAVAASAFVKQGNCLRQAVSTKSSFDALFASKEWVAAVHALGLLCISLQFRFLK